VNTCNVLVQIEITQKCKPPPKPCTHALCWSLPNHFE